MSRVATALALALLIAQVACAATRDYKTLMLPHPPKPGETAFVEVRVGALPTGHEIELTTDTGRMLGVISPHGIRPGRDAGIYTVPLPANVIRDGRVRVRLTITRAGAPPRAPSVDEVRGVRLLVEAGPARQP